ncbi:hypothetical protein CONCODRAFT_4450 [Conidiobolus coronatus NRRL 28638]|uniref:LSM domain-containing protein n=1 Tax=Conidiobolus coronatus (strain ATCC 28846 / CBS 209.66 / NRRL 28638) TaxID=796925 RepID=A0A137PCI7_CONC2|nr:hypothetical protein CONCODRAFT_4450 [Conidiobolus coronatus NRRL 28638]|eukprot:KXN72714.1 hypothetical protein CONCODRAFT_4450 [Conidiobolus coronatus NRRL 28638]
MEQSERASSREITLNFLTKLCKTNQKCRIEMIDGIVVRGNLSACDRLNKYLKLNQVTTPSGEYETLLIRWDDIIIINFDN